MVYGLFSSNELLSMMVLAFLATNSCKEGYEISNDGLPGRIQFGTPRDPKLKTLIT